MPTYEYHCPSCKKNYDLQESFSAATTHACKKCGKGPAKRVLHAPRVHFKGSGFYATDSRKSTSATSDAASSTSAKSESSASSASEGAEAAAG